LFIFVAKLASQLLCSISFREESDFMKLNKMALLALLAIPAFGHSITYTKTITFTDPNGLYTYSGTVDFSQSGSILTVVLTNDAEDAANFRRRVLTGVFWDLAGDPNVTKNSAAYTAGSVQINGGDSAANIGKHWGFKQGLGANQWGNANYGISAVGLGFFGPPNAFIPGTPQQGVDYGLVPTAGSSVPEPLVKDSMTFKLNLPGSFTLTEDSISNVWFQYGSNVDEYFFNVPEPGSMIALALGAIGLASRKRRKK
jgi:hypothetical protein